MKALTFRKKGVIHEPIKHWCLEDGNMIAIYQGERGTRPDLDFIVKYLSPGKRLRAPSHTHWIVDLIIKAENEKELVKEFINEWINLYDSIEPFQSIDERKKFKPNYHHYMRGKYGRMGWHGNFGIEFLSIMIELFIKCGKRSEGAFMFKNLLGLVKQYCENKKDFYQIISYSKRV